MKRGVLLSSIAVAAVLVAWLAWRLNSPEPPPPPPRFDGVRARVAEAMYVEEDPETGNVLIIKAVRATSKDGKVGKLFRTPLRQTVELRKVQVELRGPAGDPILKGTSARATFEPGKKEVTLEDRPVFTRGDLQIRSDRAKLSFHGQLNIPGGYAVLRDGQRVGGGKGYSGPAGELGAD